jgi:hypothetical protein
MRVHDDKLKRFRVKYEKQRPNKPFLLSFFKKWRDSLDPTGSFKELKTRSTHKTKAAAIARAEEIIESITSLGTSAVNVSTDERTQLIALANQLKSLNYNAASILASSIETAKAGFNPQEALDDGLDIAVTLKDYSDYKLQHFIDLYADDYLEKEKRQHPAVLRDLNNQLTGLGAIPVKTFMSLDKSREALKPILQAYCDKSTTKRFSSLQVMRSRIRQILKYIQPITKVPTKEVLNQLTVLGDYKLKHRLKAYKPDYAFRASEFLLLIKFFSQEKYLEPLYPIVCGLMGARRQLFQELKWEHIDLDSNEITIPTEITKLGRQGQTTKPIAYTIDTIPNLRSWLLWGLELQDEHNKKRDLLRLKSRETIGTNSNIALVKYKHLFKCKPQEGDDFNWENVAHNAFRNSFMTYSLSHPAFTQLDVSVISNDFKSHKSYISSGVASRTKEAQLFFSITPSYLGLVDLDNGTIDTDFLYSPLAAKFALISKEHEKSPNSSKFHTYFSILLEKGYDEYYIFEIMEAMNCSRPNILVNSDPSSRDKKTQPDVYSDSEEYIDKQDGMAKDYLDAGDFLNKFVKDIEGLF